MRLMLKPALRRLWRDEHTLQLGVDPQRAVVLSGVGRAETRLLVALDGTLDRAGLRHAAEQLGVPVAAAERLVSVLAAADALDDAAANEAYAGLHERERARLLPDRAALSLVHRGPGAADRVLAHRRRATVRVVGAGRIGAPLAALLAAAGVGAVSVDDPTATRPADSAPGGVTERASGLPRDRAAANAISRAAPEANTSPAPDRSPDLTILTSCAGAGGEPARLLRAHLAHLAAGIRETTGVVGPLVVPGATACLRCLELTRSERDPCWPQLAAQLAGRREQSGDPCDVVLAAAVAAQAAAQALAYLDSAVSDLPPPATRNGTLELACPDWRWRRRSWSPHPSCGCSWA